MVWADCLQVPLTDLDKVRLAVVIKGVQTILPAGTEATLETQLQRPIRAMVQIVKDREAEVLKNVRDFAGEVFEKISELQNREKEISFHQLLW